MTGAGPPVPAVPHDTGGPGTALVRRPGPRLADGLLTHLERTAVDTDLALAQWEGYVAALRGAGWRVVEVPPADSHPDAVFVEDTVVVHGDLAVLTRPGAPERRGEVAAVEPVLRELGLEVAHVEAPATLDGGDVLQVGPTVHVGVGGRTDAAGVAALRALLEPRGARVVPVPVERVLHLKSAVTALPDGTVLGHPPVADPDPWPRFRAVPEESGAHVVRLGGRRLLLAADAPRTADLLRGLGWEPVAVDVSEFQRLEGCVTCLSVRLRRGCRGPCRSGPRAP